MFIGKFTDISSLSVNLPIFQIIPDFVSSTSFINFNILIIRS
jgi:hypothetical protein